MQPSRNQDTLVGLFVAAGIAGLFFLSLKVSNLSAFSQDESYTITARFENTGGLKVRSAVSAAGVKIGQVSDIYFDTKTYQAVVTMHINQQYNTLPDDTTASIFTSGLLGEQYVNLEPGGSDSYLTDNGKIDITQPAIILEKAIGQFLFKAAEEKGESKE
ncbi:MAG: outer membrane lipid asymmetry maintenance protein MlaD [Methylococcaceae bacterium]|nr:MAG: outer membrane lipid asymmetry maintenance protein MlaD [Methylococcaceae bacterium]